MELTYAGYDEKDDEGVGHWNDRGRKSGDDLRFRKLLRFERR
jgi:hypothetical protein